MSSFPRGFAAAIVSTMAASIALATRPMSQSECKCVIKGPCDLDGTGSATTACVLFEQMEACSPGKQLKCRSNLLDFKNKMALMDKLFTGRVVGNQCECKAQDFTFLINGKQCDSQACGEQYRQKKSQKLEISAEKHPTWQRPDESTSWPKYWQDSYQLSTCSGEDAPKPECQARATIPPLMTQEERQQLKEAYEMAPDATTKELLRGMAEEAGVAVVKYEYQEPHCIDKVTQKEVALNLCGHEDKLVSTA